MGRRLIANGMGIVTASAVLAASAMLLMAGCKSAPAPAPAAAPVSTPAPAAAPETPVATAQPIPHEHIFPEVDAAHMDIQAALAKARKEHKRVLVDFGGDWCGDCQVLNYYMHQSPNRELLDKNYVLVDVNVGHIDQNIDLGDKYGVVLKKGVPALAVLRPDGTVVYGQKNGEFENMRHMESSDLTMFLQTWKPS